MAPILLSTKNTQTYMLIRDRIVQLQKQFCLIFYEPSSIEIKGTSSAKPIINNYNNLQIESSTVTLEPYQAVIF